MPILDSNRVYDGYDNLIGGADYGRAPHLIDRGQMEQYQEAENVVCRGGSPTNRPGLDLFDLTFDNPYLAYNDDGTFESENGPTPESSNAFKLGTFQGASYYSPRKGEEYIMVSINGRLYRVSPGKGAHATVREIRLERRNRKTIIIAYHCQADIYFIAQDGEAQPIIYDGISARRAGPTEIFTGTIMAYGMNRIVLVGPKGLIYFGDIRDGKGGGGADVLGFTETSFLNEGFPSAIPSSMGQPTAIAFIPQQDTATGVGECLVFGENGVESFFLSIPRETWKDSQFQRTALLGIGNLGHLNVTMINSDLWFRSADGRRSYRQARAEIDKWAQIPMSTNVRQYMESETERLLKYGSSISADNRLLATSNPVPNMVYDSYATQRLYHNGITSLDFDILSTFGQTSKPAWDGRWKKYDLTSRKVLQLVGGKFNNESRSFAFCITDSGQNAMFEITKDGVRDDNQRISAYVIPRSMDFYSKFNEKELYGGDIWTHETAEPVDITVSYRPDQMPTFQPWDSYSIDADYPGGLSLGGKPTVRPVADPRHGLEKPSDAADPVTSRLWRLGYEFQPKIEWTGKTKIRKFRMHAQEETEDSKTSQIAKT